MKSDPVPVAIEPRAYRIMHAVEDAHWWFDGMETITARLLAAAGVREGGSRAILDAGCGTGRNLVFLSRYGEVTGLDYSPVALACCRERGFTRLIHGSVNALPLADASLDLVTSFDVLTARAADDRAAFAGAARVLRPGGCLLVRVAAYDWLRGRHDDEWDIGHRYRRGELCGKLARAGFAVEKSSYANTLLLPAVMLKRLTERWVAPAAEGSDLQLGIGRGPAAWVLRTLLSAEAPLVTSFGLPGGLSLFAVARKL